MKNSIIVSVVIPSLNTASYIEQCLNSIINQTLNEIEIICVDAGSTDGTIEIIKKFLKKDPRVSLINSAIKSYGYQMNLGIKAAKGKYLGIVEPDDFIDKKMYENLSNLAIKNNLDIVKAQWFNYTTNFEYKMNIVPSYLYGKTINIIKDIKKPIVLNHLFNMPASIWSGIYNIRFLKESNIMFNETKGASFQDTSFSFKTLLMANKIQFVDECYLHYRTDNNNSSVHSSSKDFCICDEINNIYDFITKNEKYNTKKVNYIFSCILFNKYKWNYERIEGDNKEKFLNMFVNSLMNLINLKKFNKHYFDKKELKIINHYIHKKEIKYSFLSKIDNFLWLILNGGLKFTFWKIVKKVKKF